MSLTQRTEMRRCGRRYKTEVDAALSKGALVGGKTPFECPLPGCGGWHLREAMPGEPRGLARKVQADTGFPPAVKLAIRARAGDGDPDNAVCEACGVWLGRYGGEIQHIIARGSGGTSLPEIGSVVNGCLLCGCAALRTGCHGRCEKRDPEMNERGFWRLHGERPGTTPLEMHGRDGGFTRWLTPDGHYSTTPTVGDA
jgi:hypothetical protein